MMDHSNDYHLVPIAAQFKTAAFNESIQLIDNFSESDNVRQPRRQYRKGWRGGMLWGILATGVVLISSLAVMAFILRQTETSPGIHVLYQGSCSTSKHINTGAHVVMNVMSTLLLGASNFCMTVLSSPTRKEVDYWHSRKVSMDIGINSVRNLFKISVPRRMLWLILVFTSVPLHLVFNSAIYPATSTYNYFATLVTDGFLDGQSWTTNGQGYEITGLNDPMTVPDSKEYVDWMGEVQTGKVALERLENKECVEAYANSYLADRANVVVVTSSDNEATNNLNNSSLLTIWPGIYSNADEITTSSPYAWLCADPMYSDGRKWDTEPDCPTMIKHPEDLTVRASLWITTTRGDANNFPVEYCLSQKVTAKCTVESSVSIWAIMIGLVAIKLCCLLWTLLVLQDEPLVVPGDCIASFLHRPDCTTLGACLWPTNKFRKNSPWMGELKWISNRRHWGAAVSARQWICCLSLSIATLVAATILLGMGVASYNSNADGPTAEVFWKGFGESNLSFSLFTIFKPGSNSSSSLIAAVLLANAPQLLITFVYFTYNSVFTSMVMGSEWSQFAYQRKPLRVSNPAGQQQSTYRLQLPYRYGVPLMLLIVSLHWMISQTIFVLRVRVLNFQGIEDVDSSITTCGYSIVALLATIVIGALAIIVLIGHGVLRRYKPGMELAGSSTAAISAACHPMATEDVDASLGELQWGVVPSEHENEVGHCTFSAGPVSFPVEGRFYG